METSSRQRYAVLSPEQLDLVLGALPLWRSDGRRLTRRVVPRDPWRLLTDLGAVEAELDHHSVVALERGSLVLTVWTHVRDALTAADVELAERVEQLLAAEGL